MSTKRQDRFVRTELIFGDIIREHVREDTQRNIHRASVVAVDTEGGQLENPQASGGVTVDGVFYKASVGPTNPPNSVRARIVSDLSDGFLSDDEIMTFWPMIQDDHVSLPIKPGEHVIVMFEDVNREHGLWLSRVPGHTGQNVSRGDDTWERSKPRELADLFERPQPSVPMDDSQATARVAARDLSGLF